MAEPNKIEEAADIVEEASISSFGAVLLISGNVIDGLEFFGPFLDESEAEGFAAIVGIVDYVLGDLISPIQKMQEEDAQDTGLYEGQLVNCAKCGISELGADFKCSECGGAEFSVIGGPDDS